MRPALQRLAAAARWAGIGLSPWTRSVAADGVAGVSDAELGAVAIYGGLVIAEGRRGKRDVDAVSVGNVLLVSTAVDLGQPVALRFEGAKGCAWDVRVERAAPAEESGDHPLPTLQEVAAALPPVAVATPARGPAAIAMKNIVPVLRRLPAFLASPLSRHRLDQVGRAVRPVAAALEGRVPRWMVLSYGIGLQMLADAADQSGAARVIVATEGLTLGDRQLGDWTLTMRRCAQIDATAPVEVRHFSAREIEQAIAAINGDDRRLVELSLSYDLTSGHHQLSDVRLGHALEETSHER